MDGEHVFGHKISVRRVGVGDSEVADDDIALLQCIEADIDRSDDIGDQLDDGCSSANGEGQCDVKQLKDLHKLRLGFLYDSSHGRYSGDSGVDEAEHEGLVLDQVRALNERRHEGWNYTLSPIDRRLAEFDIHVDDLGYCNNNLEDVVNDRCGRSFSKNEFNSKDKILTGNSAGVVRSKSEFSFGGPQWKIENEQYFIDFKRVMSDFKKDNSEETARKCLTQNKSVVVAVETNNNNNDTCRSKLPNACATKEAANLNVGKIFSDISLNEKKVTDLNLIKTVSNKLLNEKVKEPSLNKSANETSPKKKSRKKNKNSKSKNVSLNTSASLSLSENSVDLSNTGKSDRVNSNPGNLLELKTLPNIDNIASQTADVTSNNIVLDTESGSLITLDQSDDSVAFAELISLDAPSEPQLLLCRSAENLSASLFYEPYNNESRECKSSLLIKLDDMNDENDKLDEAFTDLFKRVVSSSQSTNNSAQGSSGRLAGDQMSDVMNRMLYSPQMLQGESTAYDHADSVELRRYLLSSGYDSLPVMHAMTDPCSVRMPSYVDWLPTSVSQGRPSVQGRPSMYDIEVYSHSYRASLRNGLSGGGNGNAHHDVIGLSGNLGGDPYHHQYGYTPPEQRSIPDTTPGVFRRTPGARRPLSIGGSDVRQGLNPQPLLPVSFDRSALSDRSNYFNSGLDCNASAAVENCLGNGMPPINGYNRNHSPSSLSGDHGGNSEGGNPGVRLLVSNLDYNITLNEWKKILVNEFADHIKVLSIDVQMQADNTTLGFVKVLTMEDARYAISHFHRKKIGYKRIHVALLEDDSTTVMTTVKCEVRKILIDATGHRLPLENFMDQYRQKFKRSISVNELFQLKEVVEILDLPGTGSNSGRYVALVMSLSPFSTLSSPSNNGDDVEYEHDLSSRPPPVTESTICQIHCISEREMGLCHRLPFVVGVQLKTFSAQVHTLLQSHNGSLVLFSFPVCFRHEFEPLVISAEDTGVSLEHLISCVQGIQVTTSVGGVKRIRWAENRCLSPFNRGQVMASSSPVIMSLKMTTFSHEFVELLKNTPRCRVLLSKFIPAYQSKFDRACRVIDYSFVNLVDMLESIPHVAQVIGCANKRYVTLSHRAQVKRFIDDMLRVFKTQMIRQISLVDLPNVFYNAIGRKFDITDYGLCSIEDMVSEVPEAIFTVFGSGAARALLASKRDQSPDEIERTKQFAVEAIQVIRQIPLCRLPFSQFIPDYHHFFGRQCRVADYGFNKLIELLEAIPESVKIVDDGDEKVLCLSDNELLRLFGEQVVKVLCSCPPANRVALAEFNAAYSRTCRSHPFLPANFAVKTWAEVIAKVPKVAKVITVNGQAMVTLVDTAHTQTIVQNVLLMLFDLSDEGLMSLTDLHSGYQQHFGHVINLRDYDVALDNYVQVTSTHDQHIVKLRPLQRFARDVRNLLQLHAGRLDLNEFEPAYAQHFGTGLTPASYGGYANVTALLQAVSHVVILQGRPSRWTILLSVHFQVKLYKSGLMAKSNGGKYLSAFAVKSHGISSFVGASSDGYNPSTSFYPASEREKLKEKSPSSDSGCIDPRGLNNKTSAASIYDKNSRALLDISYHETVDEDYPLSAHERSTTDLMAGGMPSGLPSPELQPWPTNPSTCPTDRRYLNQDYLCLTDPEKCGLLTPLCRTPVSDLLYFASQQLPLSDTAASYIIPSAVAAAYNTLAVTSAASTTSAVIPAASNTSAMTAAASNTSVVTAAASSTSAVTPSASNYLSIAVEDDAHLTDQLDARFKLLKQSTVASRNPPRRPRLSRMAANFSIPADDSTQSTGNVNLGNDEKQLSVVTKLDESGIKSFGVNHEKAGQFGVDVGSVVNEGKASCAVAYPPIPATAPHVSTVQEHMKKQVAAAQMLAANTRICGMATAQTEANEKITDNVEILNRKLVMMRDNEEIVQTKSWQVGKIIGIPNNQFREEQQAVASRETENKAETYASSCRKTAHEGSSIDSGGIISPPMVASNHSEGPTATPMVASNHSEGPTAASMVASNHSEGPTVAPMVASNHSEGPTAAVTPCIAAVAPFLSGSGSGLGSTTKKRRSRIAARFTMMPRDI